MATGSGKTVVMAILIAWQTLNKAATPQNKLCSKRFLVITPGRTGSRDGGAASSSRRGD